MEYIRRMLPQWLKDIVSIDQQGNLIVGKNKIKSQTGEVKDNLVIGEDNSIVAETKPGEPVVIRGNVQIGRGNTIKVNTTNRDDPK
jgi:NDP-sugar pyrophosphorylase family protein